MGAAPAAIEALLQSVTSIQSICMLPKQSYPRLTLTSSKSRLKTETIIVGMLKCKNGSSHIAEIYEQYLHSNIAWIVQT